MTMPASIKLPSGESIPTQTLCPPPPKKHHRETKSQYLHRVSLVAGNVAVSDVQDYLRRSSQSKETKVNHTATSQPLRKSTSASNEPHQSQGKALRQTEQTKPSLQKSDTPKSPSPAIRSIAIYKQRKYLRCCLRRILFVIYRYALRRRYKKYSAYAIVIQKYVRRDFVTNHLESLILALMKRKSESDEVVGTDLPREPRAVEEKDVNLKSSPPSETRKGQLVQRQLSNESTSSTGALKLFKQVSGTSDDTPSSASKTSKPPMHPTITSSSSSKGLGGGLIPTQLPSPLSQRSLGGDAKQNPKTLNQKRSFSRTYSDVLARKEELMSILVADHKEDDDETEGKYKTLNSMGSDLSEPYSPAITYVPHSPDLLSTRKELLSGADPSQQLSRDNRSSTSLSDPDDLPAAFSKSQNGFSPDDLNRLSIGSESTVKTSDTLKREDSKPKPPLESRGSFSLSNFSITRPFSRADNKSPIPGRPNLATITEGSRLHLLCLQSRLTFLPSFPPSLLPSFPPPSFHRFETFSIVSWYSKL
jgi:hypothetical protein